MQVHNKIGILKNDICGEFHHQNNSYVYDINTLVIWDK